MGFANKVLLSIGSLVQQAQSTFNAQEYHQTMAKVDTNTYNMWNRVRDNPQAIGAIESEAYQEGMKHPIGHSMSIPQQRLDAIAAARKYPRRRGLPSGGGKFLGALTAGPAYNLQAEEAWSRGWNRAVEDQKKRLNQFNIYDRPYQGRK